MYTPPSFAITDWPVIASFVRDNGFGTLLTVKDGNVHDTRTPFIFSKDEKYLFGHVAKANPQWRNWGESTTGKVLFSGPHCYVSPRFYSSEFNVPTWNYTAVSISGLISVVDAREQRIAFLQSLVSQYEARRNQPRWELDLSDERFVPLLSAIVVFRVHVLEVEASFKLSQNKSKEDRESVIRNLSDSNVERDRQVGELMQRLFQQL